jgi:hypothetical protein
LLNISNKLLATIPKSAVKKVVHFIMFWRYRSKKSENDKEKSARDEHNFFNEEDNNIENIAADNEYVESRAIWVRGARRISNQVC